MKKLIAVFLTVSLLLLTLPTVSAAAGASLSGPDQVRAGDTITLTFSISGENIYGISGTVSYDASLVSLKSYAPSVKSGWEGEFNGDKFVFYDDNLSSPINGSATVFKATFLVRDLPEGTELSISVQGVKLSDADFKDTNVGTKTYKTTILPPLSGNCDLASMTVSNATVTPAFSPDVISYSASVPFTTDSLELEAAAAHAGATISLKNTSLTPGATTTVKIVVKAENGTEKTYSIRVKRAQDPNYVPSADATLQELAVEGFLLSPAFSPEETQYYVWLPYEAENLAISAKTTDKKAAVLIGGAEGLAAGQRLDIPVTVTAEDGTVRVYTITAVRAPAHQDTEAYLAGRAPEGAGEPEVDPTEPVTEPTEPSVPTTEPAKPTLNPELIFDMRWPAIILSGACLASIVLGLLLGILLSPKQPASPKPAQKPKEPEEEPEEDMPEFDIPED